MQGTINNNGIYLLRTLENLKEPATITQIVNAIKKNSDDSKETVKNVVESVLQVATENGIVHCANGRYFVTPNIDFENEPLCYNTDDAPDGCEEREQDNTYSRPRRMQAQTRRSRQESTLSKSKTRTRSRSQRRRNVPAEKGHYDNDAKDDDKLNVKRRKSIKKKIAELNDNDCKSAASHSKTSCRRPSSNSMNFQTLEEDESECLYPLTRSQTRSCSNQTMASTERVGESRSRKRKRDDTEDTYETRSCRLARQQADDYERSFSEDDLQYEDDEHFHYAKRPCYGYHSAEYHHQYFDTYEDDDNPVMSDSSSQVSVAAEPSEEMVDAFDDDEADHLQPETRTFRRHSEPPCRCYCSHSRCRRYN